MEKEKKFIPSQTNASKIRRKIGEQYILAAKMIKANKEQGMTFKEIFFAAKKEEHDYRRIDSNTWRELAVEKKDDFKFSPKKIYYITTEERYNDENSDFWWRLCLEYLVDEGSSNRQVEDIENNIEENKSSEDNKGDDTNVYSCP